MYQQLNYEIEAVMPQALATGLFSETITIMAPTGQLGPSGAPLIPPAGYAAVAGLSNLPIMDAPHSVSRIQSTEVRALEKIMAFELRHVIMNGYYQQMVNGVANGWVADIGGTFYIIMGAEPDSQRQMTRLALRLVQI